jgi:hypothetical protein
MKGDKLNIPVETPADVCLRCGKQPTCPWPGPAPRAILSPEELRHGSGAHAAEASSPGVLVEVPRPRPGTAGSSSAGPAAELPTGARLHPH